MNLLIRAFVDLCLLRQTPQVLPSSRFLIVGLLGLHWALGVVLSLFNSPWGLSIVSSAVGTLLVVALVQVFLLMRGLGGRFNQTLAAMVGCELVLGVIALPLAAWFHTVDDPAIPALFAIALVAWSVAIATHIFRHSLSVTPATGFLAATGYMFVSYFIAGMVAGPGG